MLRSSNATSTPADQPKRPLFELRKILWIALGMVATLLLVAYGWKIEPQWIEITRSEFDFPIQQTMKIAHLSDVHVFEIGARESKTFEILERERPDLIVITGDLVFSDGNWEVFPIWLKQLTQRAPPRFGTWVTLGNWEHWRPNADLENLIEASGGKLLLNRVVALEPSGLILAGFDDDWLGKTESIQNQLTDEERRRTIGLIHSPSGFRKIQPQLPIVLGGHTHGGQIRWPFGSALYLPPSSDGFDHGWYKHERSRLYVSRGVGTSTIDFRLFCRPEIHLLTLQPDPLQ